VTVVQNLAFFTGEKKLADALMVKNNVSVLFSTLVTGYESVDGALTGIRVKNSETGEERSLKADGCFLAVGLVPENEIFAAYAQLDQRGYFASGEDCRTATPGVFVAGDCRRKFIRQVTTAAGDGAVAAMAACRYLD
jgi:thioredoxin reductase (NADPH)